VYALCEKKSLIHCKWQSKFIAELEKNRSFDWKRLAPPKSRGNENSRVDDVRCPTGWWSTVPVVQVSRARLRRQDCRAAARTDLYRPIECCRGHALDKPPPLINGIYAAVARIGYYNNNNNNNNARSLPPRHPKKIIIIIIKNRTHYLCFPFLIPILRLFLSLCLSLFLPTLHLHSIIGIFSLSYIFFLWLLFI